jgi:hypothetical protein
MKCLKSAPCILANLKIKHATAPSDHLIVRDGRGWYTATSD